MIEKWVTTIKNGLYRIYWKGGGSSLAVVGCNKSGDQWFAPTNWVSGPSYNYNWGEIVDIRPIEEAETVIVTLADLEALEKVWAEERDREDYAYLRELITDMAREHRHALAEKTLVEIGKKYLELEKQGHS